MYILSYSFYCVNITNVLVCQNEGLPNISGGAGALWGGQNFNLAYSAAINVDGAFRTEGFMDDTQTVSGSIVNDYRRRLRISFNASRNSALYGRSSHNTPINTTVRIWKRIN